MKDYRAASAAAYATHLGSRGMVARDRAVKAARDAQLTKIASGELVRCGTFVTDPKTARALGYIS